MLLTKPLDYIGEHGPFDHSPEQASRPRSATNYASMLLTKPLYYCDNYLGEHGPVDHSPEQASRPRSADVDAWGLCSRLVHEALSY